jgi:hypothetical protein
VQNTPKKIANLQVKIVKTPPRKEKRNHRGLLKFEGTDFATHPTIMDSTKFPQPELNRIIKTELSL